MIDVLFAAMLVMFVLMIGVFVFGTLPMAIGFWLDVWERLHR